MIHKLLFLFGICLFALPLQAQTNRPIDGFGTNTLNPEWGAASSPFQRVTDNAFADGYAEPAGADRPNARVISNAISNQTEFLPNEKGLSDFIWGWGQFIDHDINLNDDHPTEFFPISVPADDEAIARGEHLVNAVANCNSCHGENLTGSIFMERFPVGRIVAGNLTKGAGGIGQNYTTADWVRAPIPC